MGLRPAQPAEVEAHHQRQLHVAEAHAPRVHQMGQEQQDEVGDGTDEGRDERLTVVVSQ